MTNEQREAIETCKEKIIEPFYNFPNPISIELKDTDVGAIETILSLIKEQQEEIEKKDKQIDLMAQCIDKELSSARLGELLNKNVNPLETYKEDIKQYFERKVEDVKD